MKGEQTMTEAQEARLAMRQGTWTGPTVHQVKAHVQANLVVLPRPDAYDFLVYCQRNAKACPVIEVTDPGDPEPRICAPGRHERLRDIARQNSTNRDTLALDEHAPRRFGPLHDHRRFAR